MKLQKRPDLCGGFVKEVFFAFGVAAFLCLRNEMAGKR